MTKESETTVIEENAMFAKIHFPYSVDVFSTGNFHCYFFAPIGKDAASLDRFNEALTEAEVRLPKNYEMLEKRIPAIFRR